MEYREFRAGSIGEGDDGKLTLRAAPFNSETVIGDLSRGGWKEEIAPGCFAKALREGDTLLLADHDMAKPVARTGAGTLRLTEGKTHLEGDADPTDTSYYRDLRANIKSGNKGGMSIGFIPVKDEWFDNEGRPSNRMAGTKRVLREVKLPEVSIVTNPAYKDTAVFARDDSAALLEERAAKASYADLETCGECGATGQYGSFCSGCGEPMSASKPAGAFCTSCGGAIDANSREAHKCDEAREAPEVTISGKDYTDMAAQLIKKYNELPAEDRNELASDVCEALEQLRNALGVRSDQEPDSSTPDDGADDFALWLASREASHRSRDLGYVEA